jgi:hypothetical protein
MPPTARENGPGGAGRRLPETHYTTGTTRKSYTGHRVMPTQEANRRYRGRKRQSVRACFALRQAIAFGEENTRTCFSSQPNFLSAPTSASFVSPPFFPASATTMLAGRRQAPSRARSRYKERLDEGAVDMADQS